MRPDDPPSRREFLASSSVALGAGALCRPGASGAPGPPARLALHGGEKAGGERMPKLVRWGKPEKGRLDAMIRQDTLLLEGAADVAPPRAVPEDVPAPPR